MEQVPRAEVTNKDLSEMLNLTVSQISRLRNGKRNPSIATVNRIARMLGWNADQQSAAVYNGTYGEKFEEFLRGEYGE